MISFIIIIIVALLLFKSCSTDSDTAPLNGGIIYDDGAVEGGWNVTDTDAIVEALNEKVDEGMINISMNPSPIFPNGTSTGNLMIVNDSITRYPQFIQLSRHDPAQLFSTSGLLPFCRTR